MLTSKNRFYFKKCDNVLGQWPQCTMDITVDALYLKHRQTPAQPKGEGDKQYKKSHSLAKWGAAYFHMHSLDQQDTLFLPGIGFRILRLCLQIRQRCQICFSANLQLCFGGFLLNV